ncbi:hypothetical protein [Streptomyces sp. BK022]|uniref:hypothetical protein n=1 Tax=Streptomyces sp. BK022 TaxID=2512123 RepID=UPI00102A31B1|nr:hypothetical protein [Streptomyces sp. BK022]
MFLAPVDADPADPSAWKEIGYVTDSSFTETPEWDTADPYPFAHLKISPFTASVSMSRCRVFHPWIYPPCVDAVAAIEKRAVRWRAAAILAEALHRPLWPCPLPFAGRNVSERLCCR